MHTGIHLSTHARCRVWKRTRRNRQQHRTTQQQHVNVAVTTSYTLAVDASPPSEDDELRDRKRLTNRSDKEKVRRANDDRKHQQRHYPIKTQHTAATPPVVIPVHTGIHSSTRARCRVWKLTYHNQQLHRAKPTTIPVTKR
ncbi:hypothetical protein D8T54_06990 [Vibrio vulnificus]|nr:hypothetical protein D8T54_06990 [Vibrio vulnificus]